MHYYRYRPATEISFKELLYNEMYFCSPAECNDPFDSKTYYQFSDDIENWKRLVKFALKGAEELLKTINVEDVAKVFAKCCPCSFEDVLADNFPEAVYEALPKNREQKIPRVALWNAAFKVFEAVRLYKQNSANFVSFSRSHDESLMWSHYASNHTGFCLIFKSIDGKLSQYPVRAKKHVSLKTPRGIAPQMSYELPQAFQFEDVKYVSEVKPLDAFQRFPTSVGGKALSEGEKVELVQEQFGQYFQKHIGWSYEKESRLSLPQPEAWLFGEHYEFSPHERLLHFEPTQLVGLIFGCRTASAHRVRLSEIVQDRMERIARGVDYPRIIFDFAVLQAELAPNAREVQIKPLEVVGLSSTVKVGNDDFPRRYQAWCEGRGLRFEGNSCSKVKIEW